MAFRFTIVTSSVDQSRKLVITDTSDSSVVFDRPTHEVYYSTRLLNSDIVSIIDSGTVNEDAGSVFEKSLSETEDSGGTTFTASSFRTFAQNNLGNRQGGGNGSGVASDNVFVGADRAAAEAARDAFFVANPNRLTDGLRIILVFDTPEVAIQQVRSGSVWVDLDTTLSAQDIANLLDTIDHRQFTQDEKDKLLAVKLYPSLTEEAENIVSTKTIIAPDASFTVGNQQLSNGGFIIQFEELASQRVFYPIGYELTNTGTETPFIYVMGAEQSFPSPADKSESVTGSNIQFAVRTTVNALVTAWELDSNADTDDINVQVRIVDFSQDPPIFDYGRATGNTQLDLTTGINNMDFPVPLFIPADTTLYVTMSSVNNIDLKGQTITTDGSPYATPSIVSTVRLATRTLMATEDFVNNAISNIPTRPGTSDTGSITSFSISGQSTSVNVPFSLSGTQAFNYAVNNPSLFTGDLTILQDGVELSTSVSTSGTSVNIEITPINLTAVGESSVFTIRGTDTNGNTETRTFTIHAAGSNELVYFGISTSNNPASVTLSSIGSHIVGTGTLNVSTGQVEDGEYFIVLVPTDHDIVSITDDILQHNVLEFFTRTNNVRQISGTDYISYVIGPLNADTDGETYTLMLR